MSEALDLSNPQSIQEHRDAIVADLPNILAVGGFADQINQLHRGAHDEVVTWFSKEVSVGGHGANAGKLGFTAEQTLQFNPIARDHGLIAPSTRLWTPQDAEAGLVEASKVGDIVDYRVLPDFETLPGETFRADENLIVDALFTGIVGRVDASLELAVRSELPKDGIRRLTVLTGMRAIGEAEGANGLYKEFLPEGISKDIPIQVAFPSAADATLAILRKRCSKFERIDRVEDSAIPDKPANRVAHPTLGSRTWITETYDAVHADSGVTLRVTVVNGEPIIPTDKVMNRDEVIPAPTAAETLKDYLQLRNGYIGNITLGMSYAHLGRIGAEVAAATKASPDTPRLIGTISLVGNMPLPVTWNKDINGLHNGGTLGFKEVYPYIKALNILQGRPEGDLGI